MGAYYDEIEIEDMAWDEVKGVFHHPCPCGDRFEISRSQLANYEDIATCPSCSLVIRVVYDPVSIDDLFFQMHAVDTVLILPKLDFEDYAEDEDDGESGEEPESDSNDSEEDSNAPGSKEPEVKSGSDEALQDSFNKLDLGEPEKTDGPQSASIVSAVAV